MSDESIRARVAQKRRRNMIAKSLYDKEKNFSPKYVEVKRNQPRKITGADIRQWNLEDDD